MTGRRPKRSERLPTIGLKTNCITAKEVVRIPPQMAASASVRPPTSSMRSGITRRPKARLRAASAAAA